MADPDLPSDPYAEPDVDTYRGSFTAVLRTLLRQPQNFSPAVLRLMDNKVTLQSDVQRTNNLDTILPLPIHRIRFRLIPSSFFLVARTTMISLAAVRLACEPLQSTSEKVRL